MTSPTFDWRLPYEPTDKLTTFEHESAPHDHTAVLLSPLDPDSPPSSFSSGSKRSFSSDEADGYDQDSAAWTQSASPKRVQKARKLPRPDDLLPALLANGMFVDNTRFLLALPDRFEYLLLLPPRFGKSVLLSTLHAFFDIHRATEFSRRFKSLAAVRDAPAGHELVHNQHLLLEFNFHSFTLYSRNLHVILPSVLDSTYRAFVTKYARELNLPRGVKDLDEQKDLFPQLLDAVHRAGRSIIATVDDFDGPFRPFPPMFYTSATWGVANPQETAELFDTKLWAPLRSATHVIHKLFVAGTFLPAMAHLPPLAPPELLQFVGFPKPAAVTFAAKVLGCSLMPEELREFVCDYASPSVALQNSSAPILHPQVALDWLERRLELQDDQGPRDRPNLSFVFVSDILFALPQSTNDPKLPSLEGLITLVTAGSVKSDAVDAYVESDPRRPTWAALYYAGALLHDVHSSSYSVANYQVLELIHKQLDEFLAQRQDNRNGFELQRYWQLFWGSHSSKLLLDAITDVLRDAMRLSRFSAPEPNLFGVLELVLRRHDVFQDEIAPFLSLQGDIEEARYFIHNSDEDEWMYFDIYTISLVDLWHGRHINEGGRPPNSDELSRFFDELVGLDEAALLKLPYRSSVGGQVRFDLVESRFVEEHDAAQLLAVGGARVLLRWQAGVKEWEPSVVDEQSRNRFDGE